MVRSFAPESTQRTVALVEQFASQHLDNEYLILAKKLIAQVETRPELVADFESAEMWAACMVHSVASVNFLFDKAHPLYVNEEALSQAFGVDGDVVATKSLALRNALGIRHFDPEYAANQLGVALEDNLVKVDDHLVAVNELPGKYQQMVRNARQQGKDVRFLLES